MSIPSLDMYKYSEHIKKTTIGNMSEVGFGKASAHHGEILQGVFEFSGTLHRGLVTLPCPLLQSQVKFTPNNTSEIIVVPNDKSKVLRATKLFFKSAGLCNGGELCVTSNIPTGWGLGSSTSDVTAAIRAVADSLSYDLTAEEIGQLAVKSETASDSIMFGSRAVLFAHREGVILDDLGGSLPSLVVVGFNTDHSNHGVDTLSFPPARYSWEEIESFRPMIGLLRKAVESQDPRFVGLVASASADINQKYLPKPFYESLQQISNKTGALGVQVAHSGTIAGLLFDPRLSDISNRVESSQRLLRQLGFMKTWMFQTPGTRSIAA